MAIKVQLDQPDGATTRQTVNGWRVQRTAYVTGLTGDYHQRMAQAIGANGIPDLHTAHPEIDDLFVWSLDATPAGPTAAIVQITYGTNNAHHLTGLNRPAVVEVGASLVQRVTYEDASGEPLLVTLGEGEDAPSQIAQAVKLSPQTTLRFNRLESTSPASKARTYVGKVNDSTFQTSGAGTWLCTAISGRSNDGGATYEVSYDFQYNADSWQPLVVYIDPASGKPHPDATASTAVIYDDVDFDGLEL